MGCRAGQIGPVTWGRCIVVEFAPGINFTLVKVRHNVSSSTMFRDAHIFYAEHCPRNASRKRNDSPRDTPTMQRERDELEELKLCTFTPVMFTKAYRRPRPTARGDNCPPTRRKEDDGCVRIYVSPFSKHRFAR